MMHPIQKQAFREEIQRYRQAMTHRDYAGAYRHAERAHIIGQVYAWPHTYTHLLFLVIGFKRRDWREILGQLARLALGGLGSALNRVPLGNTGGANVPMFKPMPIPDDLQALLEPPPDAKPKAIDI